MTGAVASGPEAVPEQEIERRVAIAREHLRTPKTNGSVYQRSEVIVALSDRRAAALALADARRTDLVAAMAVIGDLLAGTLVLEEHWSPELRKAREDARTLIREWSAKR